jgi:hypothetical protein
MPVRIEVLNYITREILKTRKDVHVAVYTGGSSAGPDTTAAGVSSRTPLSTCCMGAECALRPLMPASYELTTCCCRRLRSATEVECSVLSAVDDGPRLWDREVPDSEGP